jgi:hypothetical protein
MIWMVMVGMIVVTAKPQPHRARLSGDARGAAQRSDRARPATTS